MIAEAIIIAILAGLVIFFVWAVSSGEEEPEVRRIRKLKEEKGYRGGILAKTSSGTYIWIPPDLVDRYKEWKKIPPRYRSIILDPYDYEEPRRVIGFSYGDQTPIEEILRKRRK